MNKIKLENTNGELTMREMEILEELKISILQIKNASLDKRSELISQKYQNYLQEQKNIQKASANTFPTINSSNQSAVIEHEATTGKINEQVLYFLQSRGMSVDDSVSLVLAGYCRDIFSNLPFEFAVEAKSLLSLKIEGF